MQAAEFDALFRVEQEHWFYRGKRALTLYWIERLSRREELRTIVDVGAGTGTGRTVNVPLEVGAVDDDDRGRRQRGLRVVGLDLLRVPGRDLPAEDPGDRVGRRPGPGRPRPTDRRRLTLSRPVVLESVIDAS